jgi:hypothetical protein
MIEHSIEHREVPTETPSRAWGHTLTNVNSYREMYQQNTAVAFPPKESRKHPRPPLLLPKPPQTPPSMNTAPDVAPDKRVGPDSREFLLASLEKSQRLIYEKDKENYRVSACYGNITVTPP